MGDAGKTVKVLIIDDSAFNRQNITTMLSSVPGIEVVGRAGDGNEGLKQVIEHQPDVITLDLEMPKMDGYTFLRILMTQRPTPVIVISSHSERESVFKALELGALDFIAKPARAISPELHTIETELVDKIKTIARLRRSKLKARPAETPAPSPAPGASGSTVAASQMLGVVCIGASTGGPPALKQIFEALPGDLPLGILISQHMPASFTGAFARRLNDTGPYEVREAKAGDRLRAGLALLAPGSASMLVGTVANGDGVIKLEPRPEGQGAPRIVPSADRMMETAVAAFGDTVMAVVLTGMGSDGSRGVQRIHEAGGPTVAEAESTAVIFGMPDSAIRTGAVEEILPLEAIPAAIARFGMALSRKD